MWRALFSRQRPALAGAMCRPFLEGLARIGLDPSRAPRHGALTRRLRDLCGWSLETVPGLIPVADFFALLRERRFPAPDWLRHPDDLEYTPEPDLFHDVLGHLPQLAAPELRALIETLAEAARHAREAELLELERVYWFTLEFGLVRERRGALRALGAGLASSIAELQRALHDPRVERRPFAAAEARREPFAHDRVQPLYLVAPSLPELLAALREPASSSVPPATGQ